MEDNNRKGALMPVFTIILDAIAKTTARQRYNLFSYLPNFFATFYVKSSRTRINKEF
jgi:hypothetical protein